MICDKWINHVNCHFPSCCKRSITLLTLYKILVEKSLFIPVWLFKAKMKLMPHISYFRLIILPRHSRKNGIVGYQSDAIVLQEDCVLYILHEIKSSHVWKPCRNETCVLSHFPIYVHHFALSTFVWENNKVVLEGSPRCPDNHDLGKCHRLYALGSLTASNLTPKNYSWQPSGTTLKDLILLKNIH